MFMSGAGVRVGGREGGIELDWRGSFWPVGPVSAQTTLCEGWVCVHNCASTDNPIWTAALDLPVLCTYIKEEFLLRPDTSQRVVHPQHLGP